MRFLWICVGGACGTGARYLLSGLVMDLLGPSFPYGTLAVNVLGSFLLSALMHVGLETQALSPMLRLTLSTGVMGGFTTYSTFNYETLAYVQAGRLGLALLNMGATLVSCLAAGLAGVALGRALVGH
jgi:CrcB protein